MVDVGAANTNDPWTAPPGTAMFGRSGDLEQVLRRLAEGVRIVTLTGRAGVGKTRLAEAVERRLVRDGVTAHRVGLVGLDDADLMMAEVASVIGVHPLPGSDIADAVISWIGAQRLVLVLDNFEHLLMAAAAVHECIERCAALQVIVTSQAPLRLRSEHVFSLPTLPVPATHVVDVHDLATMPAVALYCERAQVADRHFLMDESNAADIAELCRRLDGLPLAIELAAARAAMLPPDAILRALDATDLAVLRRPRRDAPVRHHDLSAAIAWSYGLLEADEQDLLRRLSVIAGPFDFADVAAVAAESSFAAVLEPMSALVDLHLVDPVRGSGPASFTLPSTIRAFAAGELRQAGAADAIAVQYVRWRAGEARRAADASESNDDAATAHLMDRSDELGRVLTIALDRDLLAEAVDLVAGLSVAWQRSGFHDPHREQVERLLTRTGAGEVSAAARIEVLLCAVLLGAARDSGRDQSVHRERMQLALTLARNADDANALLRALSVALLVSPYTGDIVTAVTCAGEGLAIVEHLGDAAPRAAFEAWSGMISHNIGDAARAVGLGRAGLARARRTADSRSIISAALLLTPLATTYPELEAELPSSTELLALARSTGFAQMELSVLLMSSSDQLRRGDTEGASRLCLDALRLVRTAPRSPLAPFIVTTAASVLATLGEYDHAAEVYGFVLGDWARLVATVPNAVAAVHVQALDAVRSALGTVAFDAATEPSEHLPVDAAIERAFVLLAPPPDALDGQADVNQAPSPRLTPRQHEVLVLLASGRTNKEIARTLGVASKTVTHHLTAVYDTLGVRGRSEATAWAFRAGLVA